jgi:hypothetical protein
MNNAAIPHLSDIWQLRAMECRGVAKRLHSSDARKRMLTAAEDSDRMALNAKDGQPAETIGQI